MPPPGRPALLYFVLVPVLCGAAAAFAPGLHQFQDADSLVPVLMGATPGGWTPYYWEQNRFGVPTALISRPAAGHLENLVFQTFLTAAAAAASVALGVYYWSGRLPRPPALAAVLFAFFAFPPDYYRFQYLSTIYPFGVATALAYAALVFIPDGPGRRGHVRLAAAAVCAVLSAWVGANAALLLGTAVGLRGVVGFAFTPDERRPLLRPYGWPARVGVLVLGVAADQVLQRVVPYRTTWLVVPPAAEWPRLIESAVGGAVLESGAFALWGFAGVVLACVQAGLNRDRKTVLTLVAVLAATAAYCLLMAVVFKGRPRYLQPAAVLLWTVAATRIRDDYRFLGPLLTVLTAVLIGWRFYGGHDGLTATLDRRLGTASASVESSDPVFLAGDYWRVWPAVFHTNWKRETSGKSPVWGLTHRSRPTEPQWRPLAVPGVRVLRFPPNPDETPPKDWLAEYRIPDPVISDAP